MKLVLMVTLFVKRVMCLFCNLIDTTNKPFGLICKSLKMILGLYWLKLLTSRHNTNKHSPLGNKCHAKSLVLATHKDNISKTPFILYAFAVFMITPLLASEIITSDIVDKANNIDVKTDQPRAEVLQIKSNSEKKDDVSSTKVNTVPMLAKKDYTRDIERIVITASKRETLLQQTPMSVTAFNEEQLREAGIDNLSDIQFFTPGLWIAGHASTFNQPIVIRGIGSLLSGIGTDEAVAIYVDGIYQGRSTATMFEFADVERIEVLRGPQGSRYGRNATGGAINIITKTPGDVFEAYTELKVTEFNGIGAKAYMMAPLIEDTLSLKISGGHYSRDGWQNNPTRNTTEGDYKNSYFSTALSWKPGDNTQVVVRAYGGETVDPIVAKNLNDGVPIPSIIFSEFGNTSKREFTSVSAMVEHQFSNFTAKVDFGYLDGLTNNASDPDGTAVDNVRGITYQDSKQYSAELQISSNNNEPWQWLAGAFLLKEKVSDRTGFNFFRTMPFGPFGFLFAGEVETNAVGVFAELEYNINDKLSFTAGLRYSNEEKDWLGCITGFSLLEDDYSPSLCDGQFVPDDANWNEWTPLFIMNYQWSDELLLYVSTTKGFRSGGWNWTEPTIPNVDNGFDPEIVWSYEGGVKIEILKGLGHLNMSVFYAEYSNLQVRTTDSLGLIALKNAAEAENYGVEIELAVVPIEQLEITATVAWLDASYSTFDTFDASGEPVDLSGNRLNRSPEWQLSFMGQYHFLIDDIGTLTPRFEWQYVDEIFHDELNRQPQGSEAFDIINLALTFTSTSELWGVKFFADNITDEVYCAHTFQGITPDIIPCMYSNPRLVGANVFAYF